MTIVGKWNLNGNANAQVGSNGTATNVTWVDGKQNGAGSFNGSSSYITFSNFSVTTSSSFGIELIIKPNNVTSGYIFNQQVNTTGHFNLQLNWNAGKLEASISSQNVGSNAITSSSTFSIGQYLIITYLYDGNILYLYVNGKLEGSVTRTFGVASSTASFLLGKLYNNTTYYNGIIDELIFNNTVLTPAEIKNKSLAYNGFI